MTNGSNNLKRGSETIVTASTKTSSKKQKTKSQQVKTQATAKVQLSSKSYRTPNQVMKADHERNEKLAQLQKVYEWAVSQKKTMRIELSLLRKLPAGSMLLLFRKPFTNWSGKDAHRFFFQGQNIKCPRLIWTQYPLHSTPDSLLCR